MNSKLNDTIVDLTGLISVEIGLEMNNYFACLFIFSWEERSGVWKEELFTMKFNFCLLKS